MSDHDFFMRTLYSLGDFLCLCVMALAGQFTLMTVRRWNQATFASQADEGPEEDGASEAFSPHQKPSDGS